MIVYNSKWLDNLRIKQEAFDYFKKKWIDAAQFESIKNNFPESFYIPNIFIRIGLFIFTVILISAILGLLSIPLIDAFKRGNDYGIVFIIYSILTAAALFGIVVFYDKKIYKAGMDDALLYIALILAGTGIYIVTDVKDPLLFLIIIFPLLVISAILFSDMLVSAASYLCFFAMIFLFLIKFQIGKLILPFVIILTGVFFYLIIQKALKIKKLRFWTESLTVLKILVLLTIYLGGNYFVVREANNILQQKAHADYRNSAAYSENDDLEKENKTELDSKKPVLPLSFIFYLTTILIPVFYIFKALRDKDRIFLLVGLVILVASVLTFRYYFSIAPPEIALTAAGIVLIALAYLAIRFLKTPRYGLCYQEDEDKPFSDIGVNLDMEAVIISKTSGQTQVNPSDAFKGSGGTFGGGGSSGNF